MAKKESTVLKRSDHCVSRKNIDDDALKVLSRLRRCGHETYLVGGGVRDLLLGRVPKDFDIATAAHPNEIKKLFRNCVLIGRGFDWPIFFRGKVIETSTFRCNPDEPEDATKEASVYRHRDNTFGTAEEDAVRRDFTVNGLFYDPGTFDVIDHVGGLPDLKKRLIRCIGDPDVRFREDPVRMIRAVRFAARLGFKIERKTYRAILKHRAEIGNASPARLLEEVYKLFSFGAGQEAFKLLHKTRLLEVLLPDVARHLDRVRRKDVMLWRYLDIVDSGLRTMPDPSPPLLLGSVLYDVYRRKLDDASTVMNSHERAKIARDVLEPIARRFGMPKRVFYCLVHMFSEQHRFIADENRRFSRQRFVRREDFFETLALHEVELRAEGHDVTELDEWIRLQREETSGEGRDRTETRRSGEGVAHRTDPRRRSRRPRRRDRRPRGDANRPGAGHN